MSTIRSSSVKNTKIHARSALKQTSGQKWDKGQHWWLLGDIKNKKQKIDDIWTTSLRRVIISMSKMSLHRLSLRRVLFVLSSIIVHYTSGIIRFIGYTRSFVHYVRYRYYLFHMHIIRYYFGYILIHFVGYYSFYWVYSFITSGIYFCFVGHTRSLRTRVYSFFMSDIIKSAILFHYTQVWRMPHIQPSIRLRFSLRFKKRPNCTLTWTYHIHQLFLY